MSECGTKKICTIRDIQSDSGGIENTEVGDSVDNSTYKNAQFLFDIQGVDEHF